MNYSYRIYKIENGFKYYLSNYKEWGETAYYADFEIWYNKAVLFTSQNNGLVLGEVAFVCWLWAFAKPFCQAACYVPFLFISKKITLKLI